MHIQAASAVSVGTALLVTILSLALPVSHPFIMSFSLNLRRLVGRRRISVQQRHLTTNIIVVGKKNGGEEWISNGYAEYEKRLKPIMNIQTTFLKSDEELVKAAQASKGCIIALDERGKQHTSVEFTNLLYSSFEKGGSHVSFIVGGFAGLPDEIRNKYPLISLSKLTWTHTMARLLLAEQIYRATEIRKGSGYHKD